MKRKKRIKSADKVLLRSVDFSWQVQVCTLQLV